MKPRNLCHLMGSESHGGASLASSRRRLKLRRRVETSAGLPTSDYIISTYIIPTSDVDHLYIESTSLILITSDYI